MVVVHIPPAVPKRLPLRLSCCFHSRNLMNSPRTSGITSRVHVTLPLDRNNPNQLCWAVGANRLRWSRWKSLGLWHLCLWLFLGPLPTIFGAAATAKTLLQTKHIPDIPDLQFWFSNVKGALYRPKDLTEIVPKCTRQNRSSSVPVDFGSIQYLFQVRSYGIKWCANLEVKP